MNANIAGIICCDRAFPAAISTHAPVRSCSKDGRFDAISAPSAAAGLLNPASSCCSAAVHTRAAVPSALRYRAHQVSARPSTWHAETRSESPLRAQEVAHPSRTSTAALLQLVALSSAQANATKPLTPASMPTSKVIPRACLKRGPSEQAIMAGACLAQTRRKRCLSVVAPAAQAVPVPSVVIRTPIAAPLRRG